MMDWKCGWDDREQNRYRTVSANPTGVQRKNRVAVIGQSPKEGRAEILP